MSRYHTPRGAEVETQPGSHGRVLRNRLGITRKSEIDQMEYQALVATQNRYLLIISEETRFDTVLIRRMHREWLGGIYLWAGEYRTVDMSKGDITWPPAMRVSDNMDRFSRETLFKFTPCRPQELHDVCYALAVVHAELLLIHPFREGNGRIARWMADLMAAQAGLPLPVYGFTGRGSQAVRKGYLDAVYQGYLGRFDLLTDFFADALRVSE